MTYMVKERIGLPIWEGDYVKGIKHFMPGSSITDEDFEEARQDDDEKAMLLNYNTYTTEQWNAKVRMDEIAAEMEPLQRQADTMLRIDYEKMEMTVSDDDQQAYTDIQGQLAALQKEQRELQEVLDGKS